MSENLAVIKNVDGTALQPYRDRDEVRELAERLLSLHPAAPDVGQSGMFAVAQLALMVGASPLPGVNEISVWAKTDKDTGRKVIQFQLGINYYRRKAEEGGGVLWKFQPRQMRDDEREVYGISPGQLAAICHGVRANDMEKYLGLGFSANQIWDMVGATGVATSGVNEAKHGRPPIWTAFKRAEVDLYRRLFPTMMSHAADASARVNVELVDDPGPDWDELADYEEVLDGEIEEEEPAQAEPETDSEDINEVLGLGYEGTGARKEPEPELEEEPESEEPEQLVYKNGTQVDVDNGREVKAFQAYVLNEGKRPPSRAGLKRWSGPVSRSAEEIRDALQKAAESGYQGSVADNQKTLKYVSASLSKVTEGDKDRRALLDYLFGVESNKDLTGAQAGAIIDWIDAKEENEYTPSDQARAEAARVVVAHLKEQGQMGMFEEEE